MKIEKIPKIYQKPPTLKEHQIKKMRKNLQDFRKEDYLLAVGDPVIIGISTWLVGETTNGQFNMLKWDKREYRYYPLEVDGYQKG